MQIEDDTLLNPIEDETLLTPAEDDDETGQLYEHFRFVADPGMAPLRVDKFMSEKLPHSSRNRIQNAADSGFVHVNDRPVKSNYKVRPGDVVTLMLDRPRHDTSIVAEDLPINVVYEDQDIMVVNKEAGMVVHPGAGNFTGTSARPEELRPQRPRGGTGASH